MTANDALKIVNENVYRDKAIRYRICTIEDEITAKAHEGKRSCIIDFESCPGLRRDFIKIFGEEAMDKYLYYDVEREIRDYFEPRGFKFKLVTDAINGGVRQDPYWTICW